MQDVDISSPSIARLSQTFKSDRTNANLTFRLDFSIYYGVSKVHCEIMVLQK